MRRAVKAFRTARRIRTSPPPGPPWDSPLAEAAFAFVDLEMTGLDPARDRVVELCIERVVGTAVEDSLSTLVRPGQADVESGPSARIHGIRSEALASAPAFSDLADPIRDLLNGAVFVAHGAPWDVEFLEMEFARCTRPITIAHWLDTLHLSRRTLALPSHSLQALRAHFGLDTSRAHRADADVHALRFVFERAVAALQPRTPRDLWDVRIAEGMAREQIIAQCTSMVETGLPATVVYRPRSKPPESIVLVVTEVLSGLDPPKVIGYQLPGRGRRELRADRILRIEPKEDTL